MFGSSEPSDSALVNLLVDTGPDKYRRKNALKALATCEPELSRLASSEPIALLVHDCDPAQIGARVVAVTDRSVAVLSKKKVEKQFSFKEIAETRLFKHPRGILVAVETFRARNDYHPDDSRRFGHIIQFFTATPGAANLICAAIDPHLN